MKDQASKISGSVFIIRSEIMGEGDATLGAKLLANFFRTLVGVEPKPGAIIFYNAGVRALAVGSPHLDALKALDDAGVDFLACTTCLEYFDLMEKMAIGAKSNMREITQLLMSAEKVVSL